LSSGFSILLKGLSNQQVEELARRYSYELTSQEQNRIIRLFGRHPYLIQKTFYEIVYGQDNLERLWGTALIEKGIYSDHLKHYLLPSRFKNTYGKSAETPAPARAAFR
jgi:hypothetical protein